jgi:uncharacterized membrane protein YeaQ/YmgE (transglycosylase-associated protein family)
MEQITKIVAGIFILILGIPIGNFLAKITKEELKTGQKEFKLIIIISIIGSIITLITKNDVLLFTFLFIIIVTSRCLRKN